MRDLFIQAIGFLGLISFLFSYQFKSNRALFAFHTLGAILFATQYALLGAATGCLSQVLKVVRSALMVKYKDWQWLHSIAFPIGFSLLYVVVAVFTWTGPLSLMVLAASVSSTFFFWTDNAKIIRLSCLVFICPCWLIYAICNGSWGGIINELVAVGSILVSIYRFGWKALGEPQKK